MLYALLSPSATAYYEITKTVALSTVPEALTAADRFVREVTIYPLRTNTGQVFIGTVATNDSQHIPPPYIITAPEGKLINLATIYIDVEVNGEGVRILAVT
jgi:hypothetical protein